MNELGDFFTIIIDQSIFNEIVETLDERAVRIDRRERRKVSLVQHWTWAFLRPIVDRFFETRCLVHVHVDRQRHNPNSIYTIYQYSDQWMNRSIFRNASYPSQRTSSFAKLCQTQAARHRSVAFKFLRICKANSGGNWERSEIFVTKRRSGWSIHDHLSSSLTNFVYSSARLVVDRTIDPFCPLRWKWSFTRTNLKPSRLWRLLTWPEVVDVEREPKVWEKRLDFSSSWCDEREEKTYSLNKILMSLLRLVLFVHQWQVTFLPRAQSLRSNCSLLSVLMAIVFSSNLR